VKIFRAQEGIYYLTRDLIARGEGVKGREKAKEPEGGGLSRIRVKPRGGVTANGEIWGGKGRGERGSKLGGVWKGQFFLSEGRGDQLKYRKSGREPSSELFYTRGVR